MNTVDLVTAICVICAYLFGYLLGYRRGKGVDNL
jgi:hypothetical protein